jgi:hypothetical protein
MRLCCTPLLPQNAAKAETADLAWHIAAPSGAGEAICMRAPCRGAAGRCTRTRLQRQRSGSRSGTGGNGMAAGV